MARYIESIDQDDWELVFVDSIDDCYDEELDAFDSDPNSPFIGKTPEECHQLLLKLCADTQSDLMTSPFAIMDERSSQDDTVLLASAKRNLYSEEHEVLGVRTVRATFQASATALMLYLTGHSSVDEDAERAALEDDNVYRCR